MKKNTGRVWVNFGELRKRLRFEDVLRHYGVDIQRKGSQHQGPCPLPLHEGGRGTRSFSANLDRGLFQCFLCGGKGNVLDFAGLMAGIEPEDGAALRRVAVELQLKFCPEGTGAKGKRVAPAEVAQQATAPAASVNAPLDFELKSLEHAHESLAALGVELKVAVHFGVGFCSRGLLKGRIAIPLHDPDGRLVGYAGLATEDSAEPRCVFPARRERKGEAFEFDRSLLLYNAHRVEKPCDDLIVVQDFRSVWWLHQCGFRQAVSLMGAEGSEKQIELIVRATHPLGKVSFLLSNLAMGDQFASSLVPRLATDRFVRLRLIGGRKLTDLDSSDLRRLISP